MGGINKSISLCIDVTDKKLAKETMDTHREILNCIKVKGINGAHDARYLHLMYHRRNIKNLIEMRNKSIEETKDLLNLIESHLKYYRYIY